MERCRGRGGIGARRLQTNKPRGMRPQLLLADALIVAPVLAIPAAAQTAANPVETLFLGNSFTHGRYNPALNYNAGPGNATSNELVHDLLCPSLTAAGVCTSTVEGVAAVTPT